MRRILENYFKFFGNVDVNDIIEDFPEEERVVCHSLLSWANDGSHHVNGDLFVDSTQETNQLYLDVFRRIFISSNRQSHFEMMMGDFENEIKEEQVRDEVASEIQEAMDQAAASQE